MSEEVVVDTAPASATPAPAEPTAPSTALRDAMTANLPEGQDAPAWMGKYGDDISLFNGIMSQASMVGKKGDIPQEGATPEAFGEFGDKLGWKESSEVEAHINLDAEKYGDSKADLDAAYNGAIHGVANQIMANLRENPSRESVVKALVDFSKGDAEQTLLNQTEGQKARAEQLSAFAASKGLTPEALTQSQTELMAREGWDDSTTIHEVMHAYASKISNSQTLQDAQLHNTTEGLEEQMKVLRIELNDVTVKPEQHKINLEKMKALQERQWNIKNK